MTEFVRRNRHLDSLIDYHPAENSLADGNPIFSSYYPKIIRIVLSDNPDQPSLSKFTTAYLKRQPAVTETKLLRTELLFPLP